VFRIPRLVNNKGSKSKKKRSCRMKEKLFRNVLVMVFTTLLLTPCCHKGAKIQPDVKNVAINISAPRLKVFQETSYALVRRGFVIVQANDSLGLITTEFKKAEESFGQSALAGIFSSKQNPEVQFVTNIMEKNGASILTITAKGRIIYKKRFYVDYIFSDEFMNVVRQIAEEIKAAAEAK
jgi:hypothetical protein